jgi:hypothetical protein
MDAVITKIIKIGLILFHNTLKDIPLIRIIATVDTVNTANEMGLFEINTPTIYKPAINIFVRGSSLWILELPGKY